MEVRREREGSVTWFVKRPESPAEEVQVHHEREQLRRAAHPGVVALASGDHQGVIRTRDAGGCSLAEIGSLGAREVAGLGSATATILADLHDLGIVHGAVRAEHVLVGPDGRPTLCSLSRAGSSATLDPKADVAGLAGALIDHLEPSAPRRLLRLLRARHRRPGTARELAGALRTAVPAARLPARAPGSPDGRATPTTTGPGPAVHGSDAAGMLAGPDHRAPAEDPPSPPSPPAAGLPAAPAQAAGRAGSAAAADPLAPSPDTPPTGPRHRHLPWVGTHPLRLVDDAPARRPLRPEARRAAILVATVTCAGVAGLAIARDRRAAPTGPCPAVDAGCLPVHVVDGRFGTDDGRFAIDLPHAVVVLGRWECSPAPLPAALDLTTGTVWFWPAWANRHRAVTAVAVATIRGATTLRVLPGRCDRLEVVAASGAPRILTLPPTPRPDGPATGGSDA